MNIEFFGFEYDFTLFLALGCLALLTQNYHYLNVKIDSEKTILVIDDEPMLRYTLRELLVDLGFQVREATHGQQGIDILQSEQIDLVLLDMVMPVLSGMEVLYKMRESNIQTPVVLSSGRARGLDPEELQQLGVLGILNKPYSMGQLSEVLEAVPSLDYHG